MNNNFNWGDDIIDSRDIIARFEELEDEYDSLVEELEDAKDDFKNFLDLEPSDKSMEDFNNCCQAYKDCIKDAEDALNEFNQSFDKDELDTLREVIKLGEDSPDWSYGETLIRESYFTSYIKNLIDDCYELPKEMDSGKWPYNHLQMDWEGAAEEAKADYFTIEIEGETYYIRA